MRSFRIRFPIGLALLIILVPVRAGDESAENFLRFALPAAAIAMTFVRDDQDGRRDYYKALGATAGITLLLKEVVDKDRPNGQSEAFPSGHASTAFSGASFLQHRYGWKMGAPAYAVATYVGWSRIDNDKHDVSDVLAGAVIGIGMTFLFTDRWTGSGVQITPEIYTDGFGMRIQGSW